jgi:hypothetical protein
LTIMPQRFVATENAFDKSIEKTSPTLAQSSPVSGPKPYAMPISRGPRA